MSTQEPVSVLFALEGLRGENLMTRVLSLLLAQLDVADIKKLFAAGGEPWPEGPYNVKTEESLYCEARQPLGRVDMTITGNDRKVIGVEVKLDAVFQEAQLDRYLRGKDIELLLVLVPRRREGGATNLSPESDTARVKVVFWEDVLRGLDELLASKRPFDPTFKFLAAQLRLYYDARFSRALDRDRLIRLESALGSEVFDPRSSDDARILLETMERLLRSLGWPIQRCQAHHYLGCEINDNVKTDRPLGWVGFVKTDRYRLEQIDDWRPAAWTLVLCRSRHCIGPHGPVDAGLVVTTIAETAGIKGITRHAEADAAIHVAACLAPQGIDPEEVWQSRLLAVFGRIASPAEMPSPA